MLISVYGHPNLAHRPDLWKLIFSFGETIDLSWVVFEDFIEVLHISDKWEGQARYEKQMSDFHEVLTHCELRDLKIGGLRLHGVITGRG